LLIGYDRGGEFLVIGWQKTSGGTIK